MRTSWEEQDEALVLHGTQNRPDNVNIDHPLIYGDYFFWEALSKPCDRPGLLLDDYISTSVLNQETPMPEFGAPP